MRRYGIFQPTMPLIFAHRGASAAAPGNTLTAFQMAVDLGADILETDVHWTRDAQIVIAHDPVVETVSNGTGKISDLTLSELKRLDFGYRFTTDGGKTHPFRGKGIRIPTLEEALQQFPQTLFNIDLKPKNGISIQSFLRVLDDANAMKRVIVASFHTNHLQRVRSLQKDLPTSASTWEVAQFWLFARGLGVRQDWPFCALQIPYRFLKWTIATEKMIQYASRERISVDVWTVDQPSDIMRLFQLGIRGIVTNRVDIANQVRRKFLERIG
ncbi:glycerophosphodiester phosphodiesterase [Alicyclobacillus sp. TC]|uniref:Glycerophosphoryl diester phosphodiesterase n=2 Tax=Alicyclobacillus tolerans TaxID=90970 RepID=A0A1M6NQ76_9BACL|nr:glycerophosphodiester phosphodiesterase [Alicyclobacillus sp. TC]SHJ97855.1 glycerophosphoryl diester phosphodiesterase [Alicyclobacillus montanus]